MPPWRAGPITALPRWSPGSSAAADTAREHRATMAIVPARRLHGDRAGLRRPGACGRASGDSPTTGPAPLRGELRDRGCGLQLPGPRRWLSPPPPAHRGGALRPRRGRGRRAAPHALRRRRPRRQGARRGGAARPQPLLRRLGPLALADESPLLRAPASPASIPGSTWSTTGTRATPSSTSSSPPAPIRASSSSSSTAPARSRSMAKATSSSTPAPGVSATTRSSPS